MIGAAWCRQNLELSLQGKRREGQQLRSLQMGEVCIVSKDGSIVYQTTEAVKSVFTKGVSRHELKRLGLADEHIVGIGSVHEYIRCAIRFAKWCQRMYGIRHIREITSAMAKDYAREMEDRELSGGYKSKMGRAIRWLDVGMRKIGFRAQEASLLLEVGGGHHSDRRPERVYTPDHAEQIIEEIRERARERQAADVVRLQQVAGLRVSEAVMIRGKDIDAEKYVIQLEKNTKGGRPRTVRVDREYKPFLAHLKERAQRHRDGHVFQGRGHRGQSLVKRVQGAVRHACERLGLACYGTHGFRRSFAVTRYQAYYAQSLTDGEARKRLTTDLGHNRPQETYAYVARK